MKKLVGILAVIFTCILCMPVFTACEGEIGTDLKRVRFTQSVYEADLNQSFKLTYKTYPASAENYRVTYEFDVPYTMYTLDEQGMFTIVDPTCKQINGKITYGAGANDYDTCVIKLKEYPTEIYFEKSADIVNAGGTYNLHLYAKYEDGSVKTIDRSMYNIELISSAPNVVSVSETGMVAVSSGLIGTVTIQARIKKLNGAYLGVGLDYPTGYTASTTLSVVDNVDYAVVALEGHNQFISTSNTYTQTTENTYHTTASQVKLKVLLYSSNNVCITNSAIKIDVISNNSFAQVAKNPDGSYIMSNGQYVINLVGAEGTACIEIISNAVDDNGNPIKFIFYITNETADAGD